MSRHAVDAVDADAAEAAWRPPPTPASRFEVISSRGDPRRLALLPAGGTLRRHPWRHAISSAVARLERDTGLVACCGPRLDGAARDGAYRDYEVMLGRWVKGVGRDPAPLVQCTVRIFGAGVAW